MMTMSKNAIWRMRQLVVRAVHAVAWTRQETIPVEHQEYVTTTIRMNLPPRHPQKARTTKEEGLRDKKSVDLLVETAPVLDKTPTNPYIHSVVLQLKHIVANADNSTTVASRSAMNTL